MRTASALVLALSQAELAERIGVDRAYISGLELGQRNPTIPTLWHIANENQVQASRKTRAENSFHVRLSTEFRRNALTSAPPALPACVAESPTRV